MHPDEFQAVADPDLELRGRGWGRGEKGLDLPTLLAFLLLSFLLFLNPKQGEWGGGWGGLLGLP